jgi:pimeloyl-ACP methyl ester carboxylesterase
VRFAKATLEACSGEGYALACEALATLDAREEAKRVKAPTLILVGSEERKSFQDAADWMQAAIPGSRKVTVPDAGHASVRDQPDFVVRTLRDFLG